MRRRSAFTLVELLVTMALIIFIMAILSEAFVVGLQTFRDLKAIGDMNERLRAGVLEIKADLRADHFTGKQRLSDPNFWANGTPREGFLRVYAPSVLPVPPNPFQLPVWNGTGARPASYLEGADADSIPSAVVTDTVLHLSVKLRANKQDRFFSATSIPSATHPLGSPLLTLPTTIDPTLASPDARYQDPNQTGATASYSSQWGEVAYFLVANGDSAGSTPLYTLYRTQLVVVPDNTSLNWPATPPSNPPPVIPVPTALFASPTGPPAAPPYGNYQEMSCEPYPPGPNPTQIYFNSPTDLAGNLLANPPVMPLRAFDPPTVVPTLLPTALDPNTSLPRGATFVIGDVISFEVQVLMPGATSFQYVQNFDSATDPLVQSPNPPRVISAIQITLRVWDKKTLQTRQITIVQDM